MKIEVRQRAAAPHHQIASGQGPQQAAQGRLDLQHDAQPLCLGQRGVTAELQRIPESLLAMQQERLARRRLASPHRLGKGTPFLGQLLRSPACLVSRPAFPQTSGQQQKQAEIEQGVTLTRREEQCPAIGRLRQGPVPGLVQAVAEIAVEVGPPGLQRDRPPIARGRAVEAVAILLQRRQPAMQVGMARFETKRAMKGRRRRVQPTLVAHQATKIEIGAGEAGGEKNGGAVGNRRLRRRPGLMQGRAEIGVDLRVIRGQ